MKTKVTSNNQTLSPITPNKIWHSPVNVYFHLQKLAEKVDPQDIETKREYLPMREARVGAVIAFVMFQRLGKPTFLQLYKPDPPDVILMQQDDKGQRDITQLEITTYTGKPKETLLEQLKRTKVPPGIHKYSENYILVANVGIGLEVEYEPIMEYLNENKTPFPVWAVQELQSTPDTLAKVVIINPEVYEMVVNIGEAAHNFQKLKLPHVIQSKRAGSVKKVRAEYTGENYDAPWETIGK